MKSEAIPKRAKEASPSHGSRCYNAKKMERLEAAHDVSKRPLVSFYIE